MTVLVYALVPPVVLAPFGIALARWLWLGRSSPPRARLIPLFIASAIEVLLWIALIASVLVLMTGDWNARALFGPPVLCVALWMMSRIWIDPSHKAARWLFIASAPLALTLLAAATWLVLIRWEF